MYLLPAQTNESSFPPADQATPEGLLAIGGDLSSARLLEAYQNGIFPWYSEGQPILWWSPDPRAVLYPGGLRVSRSLAKTLRRNVYRISFDREFSAVIRHCAGPRHNNPGGSTWITDAMIAAYTELHGLGYAHSVEAWHGNRLVGGLYGIALGRGFFGESMFSHAPDASKAALAALSDQLQRWQFHFIDCQLPSPHILSLGAVEVPRRRFLQELAVALGYPDPIGNWDTRTSSVKPVQ